MVTRPVRRNMASASTQGYTPGALTLAEKRHLRRALAIVSLPMTFVIWVASLTFGILLYAGNPSPNDSLPLAWYDRLLASCGAVLPFIIFALRVLAEQCTRHYIHVQPRKRTSFCAQAGSVPAIYVYVAVTCVRWVLYFLHLATENTYGHWVSDHVVLGSSMVSIFQAELVLGAVTLWEGANRAKGENIGPFIWKIVLLEIGVLSSAVLLMLTCGDMFYTAKYFHPKFESSVALVIGLIFFQAPVLVWLWARITA